MAGQPRCVCLLRRSGSAFYKFWWACWLRFKCCDKNLAFLSAEVTPVRKHIHVGLDDFGKNFKLQASSSNQTARQTLLNCFGVWSLGFLWSLVLGIWSF